MSNAGDYAGDLAPDEAFRLLESRPDAVLVDVRTRAEWSYVGIPDLTALGRDVVLLEWQTYPDGTVDPQAFVRALSGVADDQETPLLFLCRSGVRSVAAARTAAEAGFTTAYNITEGFEGGPDGDGHRGTRAGWKVRGLPWRQS